MGVSGLLGGLIGGLGPGVGASPEDQGGPSLPALRLEECAVPEALQLWGQRVFRRMCPGSECLT